MSRARKQRVERRQLSKEYQVQLAALSAVLFRFDPVRINLGGNTDEYGPEAETILPRLATCRSSEDVHAVVHEEFCRWFGSGVHGPRPGYLGVSVAIWDWWQRQPERNDG